jgi:uncharacterized coiled-coil DUF342 family protein
MFVKESVHNTVVAERDALKLQVTELQQQLTAAQQNGNATEQLTALQTQVNTLTTEKTALETQVQTLTTEVSTVIEQMNQQISANDTLKSENAELKKLPGAKSASTASNTETSHGAALSTIDATVEFCKENSGNISACLEALGKAGI